MWPWFRGECDPSFCVGGAIVSEPRESFSRAFRRSISHFKQLQGFASPSRIIFTCFSTFQQPFQATSRIFLHRRESSLCVFLRPNSHFKQLQGFSSATFNAPYAPKSPLKVPQSPLNVPLSPGFTLKGWVTYWILLNRGTMHHMPPSPP